MRRSQDNRHRIDSANQLPQIPETAKLLSLVTMFGAPQTVAAQKLRIESMFPADEETEKEHLRLLGIVSA
jgi:hypothetical protein